MTDGERTPWAEWYDAEKVKRRLYPHVMGQILDLRFASNAYSWVDLIKTGRSYTAPLVQHRVAAPGKIQTPDGIWHYASTISLDLSSISSDSVSIEVECFVARGSVGLATMDEDGGAFSGREVIIDSSSLKQRAIVTGAKRARTVLLVRNTYGSGSSEVDIVSILARPAL